jgi:uncharacterized glyoxalase superfamily protein PhnB/uncharacterized protein YndB with AHSA1/START domain
MNADTTGKSGEFVITRVLDAPRELVWKAFTDPGRMKHWWGPKGFTVIASKMDLRPGGTYHYGLRAPDGSPMWGKFVFREIAAPERMVFISSFSDEACGTTRHPFHQSWPLEMLSTFTFEEQKGGKTKLTIRWSPHNATEEERQTFEAGRDSMRQGWGGTLEQLEAYLAKAVTAASTSEQERAMQLNTYLTFAGQCEAAFKFYEKVLNGKIESMLTHERTAAAQHVPAEWRDKIMHARMSIGDKVLMGSDAPPDRCEPMKGFFVMFGAERPAEAERVFNALAENGTVRMPLQETFWAARFGMLVDRFGTPWMINCDKPH